MPVEHNELILGQGDVFFGRFADGTMDPVGEAYIGNTMQFQVVRDITTLPRFDSVDGQKVAIQGPIVSETHTVKFNTDNMSTDNIARWYGGVPTDVVQTASTGASETLSVIPGLYYQLGMSSTAPAGLRDLSNLVTTKLGVPIDVAANFEFDGTKGRIYVREDAANVAAGDSILFTYNVVAQSYQRITSAKKELLGSLRFVAQNRHGADRNIFMPYVHLKVEGAYDMKLDEWQNLTFTAEGRRKDSRTEYVYVESA